MIQKFVDRYMARKHELQAKYEAARKCDDDGCPQYGWKPSYREIVQDVVRLLDSDADYGSPDPERVHMIDDGNYQGTLVFVVGADGYQPCDYWYTLVSYGSCSGCDTLEAAETVEEIMTLSLHVLQQGLKKMGGDE